MQSACNSDEHFTRWLPLPAVIHYSVGIAEVSGKAAIRQAEPIGDRATIASPQHVVAAIAIIVANAGDVPFRPGMMGGVGEVPDKGAVRLAEPISDIAVVATPQNVVAPITVEVTSACDVPVRCSMSGSIFEVA